MLNPKRRRHVDFPLLQRLALPITVGAVRYPGIKIHAPRVIRLLEVLLHGGTHVGGWTIDGGWFGGHVRPENHRVARVDRRRRQHQSGKRRCVVVIRQRAARP